MQPTDEHAATTLNELGATLKVSKSGKILYIDLRLIEGSLNDETLQLIGSLQSLRELYLAGTDVGDEGLRHLVQLEKLSTLDLQNTPVTDAGVRIVRHLPALKLLLLTGSRATREAVAEIRKSMLKTRIVLL